MIKILFEIPDVSSIKEKRRIIQSMKTKMQKRFRLSAAEVDLQDSLAYAQVGAALVSNSKLFGESIMQKAFSMVENDFPIRIQDMKIHSEEF